MADDELVVCRCTAAEPMESPFTCFEMRGAHYNVHMAVHFAGYTSKEAQVQKRSGPGHTPTPGEMAADIYVLAEDSGMLKANKRYSWQYTSQLRTCTAYPQSLEQAPIFLILDSDSDSLFLLFRFKIHGQIWKKTPQTLDQVR
jgi:hypothetical protein